MKILYIPKLILSSRTVKYFNDVLQAGFYIKSTDNQEQFTLESCPVFFDNENYFTLETINQKECDSSVAKISPNERYTANHISIEIDNGGSSGFGWGSYQEIITLNSPSSFKNVDRVTPIAICKDEKGGIYKVGKAISIEMPAQEYDAIKPLIEEAIAQASTAATTTAKPGPDFFRNKRALALTQPALAQKKLKVEGEESLFGMGNS